MHTSKPHDVICGFVDHVNKVLEESKITNKKMPRAITVAEVEELNVILNLLEPMASLRDELQGDGVTSSLVIICIINAMPSKSTVAFLY